jgi:hypothetical protein
VGIFRRFCLLFYVNVIIYLFSMVRFNITETLVKKFVYTLLILIKGFSEA